MKTTVVYFTRTGTTETLAKELAQYLRCDLIKMTDDGKWTGFFGFFRAGRYAVSGKRTNISLSKDISEYDRIVLLTPIWVANLTPAALSFLDKYGTDKKIIVVGTSVSTMDDEVKKNLQKKGINVENLFVLAKKYYEDYKDKLFFMISNLL